MRLIPKRLAHYAFGVIQSGLTSAIASGFGVVSAGGERLATKWLVAWAASWALMLPIVILAAPVIRRAVMAMTREA
ncbi:DUF2798 domain-containing protein [Terrarubrum flagellatum]|uniref:DUF2798 domain-containing protein n=1 Tax=Terrirubrum flagellatum TaxID=2895980 RepID=UPI0031452F29